jgi:phospholipid/cholesterol/gamma-HCH transport system substrate-binding protein
MATKKINNIKLGLFVLAGLLLLILGLYMIGRDSNLFGRNFELRARFENVQGLTPGNNIRYSGIQVGTVKKVKIISDTLIEVTMLIDEKMKSFIHKNDSEHQHRRPDGNSCLILPRQMGSWWKMA